MRHKRFIIILSIICSFAIGSVLFFPSACSWLADDPGGNLNPNSENKYTITVHVNPERVELIQVYSGQSLYGPIDVDPDLPYCRRIRYEHLVEEKPVDSSSEVKFTLPAGNYFITALIGLSEARSEEGLHAAVPQNIHLDNDVDIMPPESVVLKHYPIGPTD